MSIPVLLKGSSGISQVSMEAEHMSKRRLFIIGDITEDSASDFMKQVMYLNTEDSDSPISVFINSSGGEINNGMLMYDVIMDSEAPIHMYCTGRAHSMGAVLLPAPESVIYCRTAKSCSISRFWQSRLAETLTRSSLFPTVF